MNVVMGPLIPGICEHLGGRIECDEFAEIHEGREIGYTRRLLDVVGHDRHRMVNLEILDQFLDLGGRCRVKRRAGLVEQNDLRLDRQRAGDAKALLLSARKV